MRVFSAEPERWGSVLPGIRHEPTTSERVLSVSSWAASRRTWQVTRPPIPGASFHRTPCPRGSGDVIRCIIMQKWRSCTWVPEYTMRRGPRQWCHVAEARPAACRRPGPAEPRGSVGKEGGALAPRECIVGGKGGSKKPKSPACAWACFKSTPYSLGPNRRNGEAQPRRPKNEISIALSKCVFHFPLSFLS